MLRVSGIRLQIQGEMPRYDGQVIYLINHTSTVDVFVLLALGLPSTRFFLWGGLRRFPPVAVIGYLIGVFFTPSQARPDKRARCFQNAERVLRVTGDSVLLSPEGRCVTTGELGRSTKARFILQRTLRRRLFPSLSPFRVTSIRAVVMVFCRAPFMSTSTNRSSHPTGCWRTW